MAARPALARRDAGCQAPNATQANPYLLSLAAFHLRRTFVAGFRMCCCHVAAVLQPILAR